MISKRSASASSCSLGVRSERPTRRGLGGDFGGELPLPLLEGGGDGDLNSIHGYLSAHTDVTTSKGAECHQQWTGQLRRLHMLP